jgi:hypothetical protein
MRMKNRALSRIRGFFTNWDQPLPLATKLRLLVRNMAIRAVKLDTCCGHHGEPGC